MKIREINIDDAEKFALLTNEIEASSQYMLWEVGERSVETDHQAEKIEAIQRSENSTIFVAEQFDKLIGFLLAVGGGAQRNKHSVYIVVGISINFRGQGVGKRLFEQMEKWAKERGICRLELTVVTLNEAALSLYKRQGFEIEGTKRNSLFIEGKYVDEYYMSKLI
ncbi:RimJ/RimL family protein N-acetyltransferase [Metabacillus crassostreae]|uniref:GNAT family N-acetyltransferase n=1 Tax=Metabacillus crassostreae TaxID=929098 RepID=UPI0019584108|nr:GNAT family N-acetyltransferase [Metabacillus crassostreae]MBM7602445.1 RimJ/RimL family protein N-acetyltransferase [Metabacillus crassostreae]